MKAEARRRRKTRSLRDAIREQMRADPDAVAATMLSTAAGAVVAARIAGVTPTAGDEDSPYRDDDTRFVRARAASWQESPPGYPTGSGTFGVLQPTAGAISRAIISSIAAL
jgi:hypothetical protein